MGEQHIIHKKLAREFRRKEEREKWNRKFWKNDRDG